MTQSKQISYNTAFAIVIKIFSLPRDKDFPSLSTAVVGLYEKDTYWKEGHVKE